MKIYVIPLTLINEECDREIKRMSFEFLPIEAPSFWYLHGALQHKFIFDKANIYVDFETYNKSPIVERHGAETYLATGIYDVEVEGYDKPCKAFMWQSEDGELLRGLVVDPTIEKDLEDAQKKYEEKPTML